MPIASVTDSYDRIREERPDVSLAVAAVKALTETFKLDHSKTTAEFLGNLEYNADLLRSTATNPIAVQAGCDHFIRFATRMQFTDDISKDRERLVEVYRMSLMV
jgi:hypothetical protein